MLVKDVLSQANILADESLEDETLLNFLNDCTAQVNTRAKALYPFYTIDDLETEMAMPEQWVRQIYLPFIAAKIKQIDASQFEYNDLYSQFERGIADFISYYVIPDSYRDLSYYGYTDPETGEWMEYTSDVWSTPPFPWISRW